MKRLAKVSVIAFALLIMLTPLLACGGAEAPPPPPPGGNQPPVINSLSAESPTIIPNGETQITCDAYDPDGDELTYTWTATAGTITKTYNTYIFWKAPNFVGEFEVSVTVDDGQGGTTDGSYTINVGATQLPVIDSLIAEPATLRPSEISAVTCNAHDPDGDELTYTWSASGGTVSGVGKNIHWKAPAVFGEFIISVLVDDGQDGITEGNVRIVVGIPETTAILTPLTGESGSVYFDGHIISEFKVGDNANNVGVRPYFSFDTTAMAGAEIKEAKLTFTVKGVVGNPSLISPFLYVDAVDYGAQPLTAAAFGLPTITVIESFNSSQPPGEITILTHLEQALEHQKPRFQVRLRLGNDQNQNSLADYIEFGKVELNVTYVK